MTHHEEDDLDQFWRDVSAEMISDSITIEEADRRMAGAEDDIDELSTDQIQDIVNRATTHRKSLRPVKTDPLPPAPRGQIQASGGLRWRLPANIAATGLFTAMLLSAGMAVMLWPERGIGSFDAMRYDHATMILSDPNLPIHRRRTAMLQVRAHFNFAVRATKEAARAGGEVGAVANEVLLSILMALENPQDLEQASATRSELRNSSRSINDVSLPVGDRCALIRELGRQSVFGISSMAHAELPEKEAEMRVVTLGRMRSEVAGK